MPKTKITKNSTIDICRYFAQLRKTYNIKSAQLYDACTNPYLDPKTIDRYTTADINPDHAMSPTTLDGLIHGFTNIFAQQNIQVPPELTKDFLLSDRLRDYLYHIDNVIAVNPNVEQTKVNEKKHIMTCDPSQSPELITFLFCCGGTIILSICMLRLFLPHLYFFKLLFAGLLFLSASVTLALPQFKKPIVVRPCLCTHPILLNCLTVIMQFCVFILSFAKLLMYLSFIAFILSFIIF